MKEFDFVGNHAYKQTSERTLLFIAMELGKVAEYHVKADVYGATGYYSDANQQKEASDLLSMIRMFFQQKGWDINELAALGEEAFLERMTDIRNYGKKQVVSE